MPLQGFDEAVFSEFLLGGVVRFGDAVGVEGERVSWVNLAFSNRTIPILEDSEHGGGGIEPLHSGISAEEKSGEMAAIRVTQPARGVVIFGEEESGEGAVRRILAKELVNGAQEALRLIQSDGALAAQIGLKIGHQESGGDSFS